YELEYYRKVKRDKKKRSPEKGDRPKRRQVAPPLVQEYVYAIQRNAKDPISGWACSSYATGTELRRRIKETYFQKEHMRLMMLSATKEAPLSSKSSDLSIGTLRELFETAGLRRGGTILILAPGENNCNSVIAAVGAIGATAVLPMRLTKLEDYPKLEQRIRNHLKEGIRHKTFIPCSPLPHRQVSEPASFLLGALRQVVQLVENRSMTREEEAEYEAEKLDLRDVL
ncbi:hypothetical protein FOZ63_017011, partial [Perkinsus olseni]